VARLALLGAGLLLTALASSARVDAADSFRLNATRLGGPLLLVGRYYISNPSYCLATKPSYGAKNYDRWVSPRCVPYTVQRADFTVSVRLSGKQIMTQSFRIDGASGNPAQGGTFTPYYLYCGLLASAARTNLPGTYSWTVRLFDPFHRPGYDIVRHGTLDCRSS
jgi:hypothetical protein